MKQIITGPFGRLAYYDGSTTDVGMYPALNTPCCAFARGETLIAANDACGPRVITLHQRTHLRATVAMFGNSAKR